MNRTRFEVEVFTVLRLNKAETEQLSELCENHYDGTVQSLSKPGPNAILNLARLDINEGKEFAEVRVSWRQLDTLCKATESVTSAWVRTKGSPDLHKVLVTLLREAGAEWKRLNPEIDS